MLITATGTLAAGKETALMYRGPFERILPEMAEDGFRGVELHILDSEEMDREMLHSLLEKNGLRLTSIGTGSAYGLRGLNLVDADPAVRKRTILHLAAHMKTLAPWHGLVIVGLIAGRQKDAACSLEEQKERLREALRELDARAGEYGVRVGIELMNRYECDFLHTLAEGEEFLESCGNLPNTVLHVDTVSMNISEADIGRAIRLHGRRIGHVHVADNDRWYPGHGHYDFRETLQALWDVGYDGPLALEAKQHPDVHTAAARSIRYLSTILENLEG